MNLRISALACFLCFLNPVLSVQAAPAAQQADFIVAVVNSEPITNSEVRAEVKRVTSKLTEQRQPIPALDVMRARVLDRLINDRAQLQIARDTGIRMDEAAIDLAVQNVAQQNQVSVESLTKRMLQDGISMATFRAQVRDQQLLSRLHEREVSSRIRITEQDIDRHLLSLQANNTDPFAKEINLAQILIAVPERATTEQAVALYAQAQVVLNRIRRGEDFARVVREVSGADRSNGGQLGLRRGDRYPEQFVTATKDVPVGGVSEIVRSGAGFHILKVLERRDPTTLVRTMIQSRAQHILLRPTAQFSQTAAQIRLADYKRRIQNKSATFADLAREYSQDGSAQDGGDLGWASPGMFVPEFEEVLDRLAEGEMSDPVVTRFGVHLIRLTERRQVNLNPRELREWARNQLKETRSDEAYTTWAQEVRGRAFVEMRDPPQ